MKIETVREKWDDEKPDPIKKLIDDGSAASYLFLSLKDGPLIEKMLGMKPDYDLLTRYVLESYCGVNKVTASECESLQVKLRKSMPDLYKKLLKKCTLCSISQEFKDKVNWKKIEKLLPKSIDGGFSIWPMIDRNTEGGLMDALMVIETYIQCGMVMFSIISKSKTRGKEIRVTSELFRKIFVTQMILEKPGRLRGEIHRFEGTEDLAVKSLELLNSHYKLNLKSELDEMIAVGFRPNDRIKEYID